jgi:hypothetical protein
MAAFEADMAEMNKDINTKLAEMAKKFEAPPTYAAVASASSAAAPPTSSLPAPAGGGARPTRIWIKGFKETLTSKYLVNYANTVLSKLPADLKDKAKAGAPGFGAVVYMDFPLGTDMGRVRRAIADMNLTHEDEQKNVHKLRAAPDVPLAIRHRGRLLGELWKLVEPHLLQHFKSKDFKLGNSNGKLFLIDGDRPTELFRTSMEGNNLQVLPHEANLLKFSVQPAQAGAWIDSASRAAYREVK